MKGMVIQSGRHIAPLTGRSQVGSGIKARFFCLGLLEYLPSGEILWLMVLKRSGSFFLMCARGEVKNNWVVPSAYLDVVLVFAGLYTRFESSWKFGVPKPVHASQPVAAGNPALDMAPPFRPWVTSLK